jgi:hypothetical protein
MRLSVENSHMQWDVVDLHSLVTSAAASIHRLLAGTLIAAWLDAPEETLVPNNSSMVF